MGFVAFVRENAPWLAAGALLTFSSSYGQTYFIAIFAGEIRAAFDLSHGAWGAIYTLGTLASAALMLWAGVLTDRFRARNLGALVLGGLGLACIAMAAVPSAWLLPVVILALRFFGQGMSSHIAVVAMARWFVATRGRALSISSMGYAAGQAIMPIVFVAAMAAVGWRGLWLIAAIMAFAAIPLLRGLLRRERTPQSIAAESHALGMNGIHWARAQALRHWLFWLAFPALIGPGTWGTALFFQQVHLAEIRPWTLVEFVALMPLYTVIGVSATFATGWAIDRFGTGLLMPFYMVPFCLGFLVLSQAQGIGVAGAGLALVAIGQGAQATLPGAFTAEFYGTRHIGGIKAVVTAVMVLGSAIGPGVSGALIDLGIDFGEQMAWIAGYFALATLCMSLGALRARGQLPAAA